MKGKGERERYIQLNAGFQRTARRDKKAFLNEQCKEIEENNRLGKTRDLLKKTGDIKGTFQASIKDISSTIRDRSCKDLTEAEEIQKKWQEYTEEQYHKGLNDKDNHDGVITLLEPDILKCEVRWAIGSITTNKASGGDGIPAGLFKIQKYYVLKCYTQYISKYGKLNSGHRTGKDQFSFQSQRRAMPKNVQTTIQLCSFPMLAS